MARIRLLSDYSNKLAGDIVEIDNSHAAELVRDGIAEYNKGEATNVAEPETGEATNVAEPIVKNKKQNK